MDVSKTLTEAWDAVTASGIPDELRKVAFVETFRLLSGVAVHPAPAKTQSAPIQSKPTPTSGNSEQHNDASTGTLMDEDEFYAKFEQEINVTQSEISKIVHIDNQEPHLSINSKLLPQGKKAQQIFLASVVIISRYIYLGEKDVPFKKVREELAHYGLTDGNLAASIKSITDLTFVGAGADTKARVRRPFLDGFADTLAANLNESP